MRRQRRGDRVCAAYSLRVTGVAVSADAKGTVDQVAGPGRALIHWDNGERGWAYREALVTDDGGRQGRLLG